MVAPRPIGGNANLQRALLVALSVGGILAAVAAVGFGAGSMLGLGVVVPALAAGIGAILAISAAKLLIRLMEPGSTL